MNLYQLLTPGKCFYCKNNCETKSSYQSGYVKNTTYTWMCETCDNYFLKNNYCIVIQCKDIYITVTAQDIDNKIHITTADVSGFVDIPKFDITVFSETELFDKLKKYAIFV